MLGLPIFTMFLATQKVYVVNSPALISQINRRQKVIDSNPPFLAVVFGKLFSFPAHDMAELLRNPDESGSLRRDTQVVEHSLLERGMPALNEIFTAVVGGVADQISTLASEGPTTIKLSAWLSKVLPLSTAHGVFGPGNPFARDPSLLDDFWEFEGGLKGLTMGVFPSVTAAGPWKARRRLVQAFTDYHHHLTAEDSGSACELVRQLADVARRHDRDAEYRARYFFAVFAAFVINTVPVTFWTIGHVVADRALFARIRAELDAAMGAPPPPRLGLEKDQQNRIIGPQDIARIREQCPLLVSTFRETLRHVGASTSTMVVREDTSIDVDGRYLLRKGALVQMTATAVHSSPEAWGPTAAAFDPERFLTPGAVKVHPAANRTFGGGGSLCPGRHLASDEVLAFAAMFLHEFDLDLADETPCLAPRDETNMLSVMKPKHDVVLRMARRRGLENGAWV
ncbi:hypothetical protein SLS54_009653 [Diplodia seriata]